MYGIQPTSNQYHRFAVEVFIKISTQHSQTLATVRRDAQCTFSAFDQAPNNFCEATIETNTSGPHTWQPYNIMGSTTSSKILHLKSNRVMHCCLHLPSTACIALLPAAARMLQQRHAFFRGMQHSTWALVALFEPHHVAS
jgi:hypothetical protein